MPLSLQTLMWVTSRVDAANLLFSLAVVKAAFRDFSEYTRPYCCPEKEKTAAEVFCSGLQRTRII